MKAWLVISLNSSPSCYGVMSLLVERERDCQAVYLLSTFYFWIMISKMSPNLPMCNKYKENVMIRYSPSSFSLNIFRINVLFWNKSPEMKDEEFWRNHFSQQNNWNPRLHFQNKNELRCLTAVTSWFSSRWFSVPPTSELLRTSPCWLLALSANYWELGSM